MCATISTPLKSLGVFFPDPRAPRRCQSLRVILHRDHRPRLVSSVSTIGAFRVLGAFAALARLDALLGSIFCSFRLVLGLGGVVLVVTGLVFILGVVAAAVGTIDFSSVTLLVVVVVRVVPVPTIVSALTASGRRPQSPGKISRAYA